MGNYKKIHWPGVGTLYVGDAFDVLPDLEPESIDSCVQDPPYGIDFMGSKWDRFGNNKNNNKAFQLWCENWAAKLLPALKPGAHLVSFGSDRTYHRQGTGVEDAGFVVRGCFQWIYFNGFPKGINLGKATKKKAGTKWKGWNTTLKPSNEPAIIARKSFSGSLTANVLRHGTGGLNVEACQIETEEELRRDAGAYDGHVGGAAFSIRARKVGDSEKPSGRWPTNTILSHSVFCVKPEGSSFWACIPGCPVRELDEQTGIDVGRKATLDRFKEGNRKIYGKMGPNEFVRPKLSAGGGSRFLYCMKPSKKERKDNPHPTVKPIGLMAYLCRLVTPEGGIVLDCFLGSGTTAVAAIREGFQFVGIEKNPKFAATAQKRIQRELKERGIEVEPIVTGEDE